MEKNKRFKLNDMFMACMCKRFLDVEGKKILMLVGRELSLKISSVSAIPLRIPYLIMSETSGNISYVPLLTWPKQRRLDDSDIPSICKFLSITPAVVAANLAYNAITDIGMNYIAQFLQENSTLLELNLMNNDICDDGILELTRLKSMMGLKSLRINGNLIGTKALKNMAMMLATNKKLTNLDVGETGLNIDSFIYFTTVLRTNRTLHAVTLNRVVGPPGHVLQTDIVVQALQQMLMVNETLRELHLQKMGFDGHDIELIVEGLKKNKSILLLDLSCNNFGDFGMEIIANYLVTKPSLLTLLINTNNIRDSGARSLSQSIPFSNVINLDISRNHMSDEGLSLILSCLKKTPPVESLFLRGNKIGNETCKILKRMLLSKVLVNEKLDVHVYWEQDGQFSCTEVADHVMPHYYCLCASTELPFCKSCTLMDVRNK